METIEYRGIVDKTGWERGPWDDEPDKVQWPDEASGLPCLIVRGPVGALCGYVGVPPGHPWHGLDDDLVDAAVHGGLTFSGSCSHGKDPARGICHVPGPGEPDDIWWLGFDCAHYGDYFAMSFPGHLSFGRSHDDVYRTIDYVRGEVTGLARQAAELIASDRRAPEVAPPAAS